MQKCDTGDLCVQCHKSGFSRRQGLTKFKDLSCEQQEEIL